MSLIGQYILSVIACGLICSVVLSFFAKNNITAGVLRMVCGLLMVTTILSGFLRIDFSGLYNPFNDVLDDAEFYSQSGSIAAEKATGDIIKENITSYISAKAAALGMEPEIDITMQEDDPCYPDTVTISVVASPYSKQQLKYYIEKEIGIPEERQIWN